MYIARNNGMYSINVPTFDEELEPISCKNCHEECGSKLLELLYNV